MGYTTKSCGKAHPRCSICTPNVGYSVKSCGNRHPRCDRCAPNTYSIKSCGNAHASCLFCKPDVNRDTSGSQKIKSCGKAHAYCSICRPDVARNVRETPKPSGHRHTDESKAKMSASWRDGSREKQIALQKTPGYRAQISVAVSKSLVGNQRAKGTKRTPKQLALIKEVHNTDKFKKDASKRTKAMFKNNPNLRKKIAESVAKAHTRGDYWRSPTNLEYALQLLLEDAGFEYEVQRRFGRYVVDAYVSNRNLVFEADGSFWYHHKDKVREAKRDAYLIDKGVSAVIHLDEHDLAPWLEA